MSIEVGFGIDIEAAFTEEDPKVILAYKLRENMQLTKDDNVTPATCYIGFSLPPETVRELFKKYDTVITITLSTDNSRMVSIGSSRRLHESNYLIEAWSINKEGITGKKMRWKLSSEIRKIIRQSHNDPGGHLLTWSFVFGKDIDHTSVRPYMYQANLIVKIKWIEEE